MALILVNLKKGEEKLSGFIQRLSFLENPFTVFCRSFAAEMESRGPMWQNS